MSQKLFNPDYLKHLCAKYGLHPSRRYGQNFLVYPEKSAKNEMDFIDSEFEGDYPMPIEQMVEAAEIKNTDTVVEIGPGFGVLTFALAEKAKKVIAYEIEKKLAPYWEGILSPPARGGAMGGRENLEIIWGNVLKAACELRTVNCELSYKVVANLPYQITSAVIRKFLEADNPPEAMVLMVQKEVAERICAKPGEMSLLAVSVQYYAEPEIVAFVPRSNFWPEPRVDSAIIKLSLRAPTYVRAKPARHASPLAGVAGRQSHGIQKNDEIAAVASLPRDDKQFFNLVKAGFANRRKLLIRNLEAIVGKKNRGELIQIFTALGLKETARAQELGVEEWKKLASKLF